MTWQSELPFNSATLLPEFSRFEEELEDGWFQLFCELDELFFDELEDCGFLLPRELDDFSLDELDGLWFHPPQDSHG